MRHFHIRNSVNIRVRQVVEKREEEVDRIFDETN